MYCCLGVEDVLLYVVDCDGTIMKCTLSIDDEINKVGKITDEGNIVFDYDRLSKWMIPNCEHAECRECKILPLCLGRNCVNSVAHGNDFYCNYTAHEIELEEMIKNKIN